VIAFLERLGDEIAKLSSMKLLESDRLFGEVGRCDATPSSINLLESDLKAKPQCIQ
jgi:hypothetical protein